MTNRFQHPFTPVNTTAPGFETTFGAVSTANVLESTSIRDWSGPTSRAVRIASKKSDDFYVVFGSTTAVAASSLGTLILGGTVEIFSPVKPSNTHIAFYSSTDVTANVTLGYGQ